MGVKVSLDILEVAEAASSPGVQVTQDVLEAAIAVISPSPTTPTGAGVTQDVLEAAIAFEGDARVTQDVLEVCLVDTTQSGVFPAGPVRTVAFAHAI